MLPKAQHRPALFQLLPQRIADCSPSARALFAASIPATLHSLAQRHRLPCLASHESIHQSYYIYTDRVTTAAPFLRFPPPTQAPAWDLRRGPLSGSGRGARGLPPCVLASGVVRPRSLSVAAGAPPRA